MLLASLALTVSMQAIIPIESDAPPIAAETVQALGLERNGYFFKGAMPRPGKKLLGKDILAEIVDRCNNGLDQWIPQAMSVPKASRTWSGNRNPPYFDDEYVIMAWRSKGRRMLWADEDPSICWYIELKPGELHDVDDELFKEELLKWIQEVVKMPSRHDPLKAHSLRKSIVLPSGKRLRVGSVGTVDWEDGKTYTLPLKDSERDNPGFSFWTDERVICLNLHTEPNVRANWFGDGQREAKWPYFSRSRFDPAPPSSERQWPLASKRP